MTFALINKMTTVTGRRQEVIDILLESGKTFDGNPNCIMYLVSEDTNDEDSIWVQDLWQSEEAHAQAMQDDVMQAYVKKSMPLLTHMPEQTKINYIGGKLP